MTNVIIPILHLKTMIKIIFITLFICMSMSGTASPETEPELILNMENLESLPRQFRQMPSSLEKVPFCTTGLENFNASASGQFSKNSLKTFLEQLPTQTKILIVDLRQEAHGFADGTAISWYSEGDWMNRGRSLDYILQDEKDRLELIKKNGFYHVTHDNVSLSRRVKETFTEELLVLREGLSYLRLPITDHCRPSDETVDTIVDLFDSSEYDWYHFHCSAGKGRSSTLMVMYDMRRNAKAVPIEEIFYRQHAIGGVDFLKEPNLELWKYPHLKERIAFLKAFYHYCQENNGSSQEKWTSWIQRNPQYLKNN